MWRAMGMLELSVRECFAGRAADGADWKTGFKWCPREEAALVKNAMVPAYFDTIRIGILYWCKQG